MKDNILTLKDCYGCGVCAVSCPMRIIDLKRNNQGFYAPQIEVEDKCINCGICLKVCSFTGNSLLQPIASYAAWINDEGYLHKCSSGGVAYAIASKYIALGYSIICVRANISQNRVEHYVATTLDSLEESIGSKYVQSYTVDAFQNLLCAEGKYVVIGTPCQIASIRKMILSRRLKNEILLIDFFCHGVPSYLMYDKYIKEAEVKIGKIKDIRWRDKRNGGWHNSWNMVMTSNDKVQISSIREKDLFYRFFLKNRCLNECCYSSCSFKATKSSADIRIGDLWGEKYKKNNDGVSGVITFSEKGEQAIVLLHENCTIFSEEMSVVIESQMKENATKPISFGYVEKKLKSDISLGTIDRASSRKEFYRSELWKMLRYYSRRIVEKVFVK